VREADGTPAGRRVLHGLAQLADLRRAAHGRGVDAGGARLEQSVDEPAVDGGNPGERRESPRERVAEEAKRLHVGQLGMLQIDDDEIEAGLGDEIDDVRRRQLDEEAPDPFAEIQHL
jgi:hypothetical protein